MELFNTMGFEKGDKVFTLLDDKKYFGIVLKLDDKREMIKVDYSAKGEEAINWFHKSFWKKVE
jgi:hypothetical protein